MQSLQWLLEVASYAIMVIERERDYPYPPLYWISYHTYHIHLVTGLYTTLQSSHYHPLQVDEMSNFVPSHYSYLDNETLRNQSHEISPQWLLIWVMQVVPEDCFTQFLSTLMRDDESLTRRSDFFCSRHVVQTISLYADRNPLNIHHQLRHNKFDALRNTAIKAWNYYF